MEIGRLIIILGIVLVIVGLVFTFLGSVGLPRLPGDIYIKRDNFTFYFPIATSILISIILTILAYIFFRK